MVQKSYRPFVPKPGGMYVIRNVRLYESLEAFCAGPSWQPSPEIFSRLEIVFLVALTTVIRQEFRFGGGFKPAEEVDAAWILINRTMRFVKSSHLERLP